MGLRYADVRTGGSVSVRSAVIQHAFSTVWIVLTSQLLQPWNRRSQGRLDATLAEAEEARRAHPEDREAQRQAIAEVFKRGRVAASPGCAARLLVMVAFNLPVLWSPLKQTFPERLAGIVVVRD